jgi:hypothetical protein
LDGIGLLRVELLLARYHLVERIVSDSCGSEVMSDHTLKLVENRMHHLVSRCELLKVIKGIDVPVSLLDGPLDGDHPVYLILLISIRHVGGPVDSEVAVGAYALRTLPDGVEVLDWHALRCDDQA